MDIRKLIAGSVALTGFALVSNASLADVLINVTSDGGDIGEYTITTDQADLVEGDDEDPFSGSGWLYENGQFGDMLIETLAWNEDPFISFAMSFQNNTGVSQSFTFDLSQTITPIAGPFGTIMWGGVAGSVTDADNSGAGGATTDGVTALYQAQVDGVTVATLYDDPSSWTGFAGGGDSLDILADSFGIPPGSLAGPATATTSIGLVYTFWLDAGDSISINGSFFIEENPIPAPGALALLGMAGFAARRRRRS